MLDELKPYAICCNFAAVVSQRVVAQNDVNPRAHVKISGPHPAHDERALLVFDRCSVLVEDGPARRHASVW